MGLSEREGTVTEIICDGNDAFPVEASFDMPGTSVRGLLDQAQVLFILHTSFPPASLSIVDIFLFCCWLVSFLFLYLVNVLGGNGFHPAGLPIRRCPPLISTALH